MGLRKDGSTFPMELAVSETRLVLAPHLHRHRSRHHRVQEGPRRANPVGRRAGRRARLAQQPARQGTHRPWLFRFRPASPAHQPRTPRDDRPSARRSNLGQTLQEALPVSRKRFLRSPSRGACRPARARSTRKSPSRPPANPAAPATGFAASTPSRPPTAHPGRRLRGCRYRRPQTNGESASRRRPAQGSLPRHARPRAAKPAGPDQQRRSDHARGRARAGPTSQWSIDVIADQIKHMTRIVDDLLDVSRITRGKVVLQKEPIELRTSRRAGRAGQPAAARRLQAPAPRHTAHEPVVLEVDPRGWPRSSPISEQRRQVHPRGRPDRA